MREDGFIGHTEWSAAGRPLPGQELSGDQAGALDLGDGSALFAVIDGLGHGPSAADAAESAIGVLAENRAEPLDVLMVLCHRALSDTRGAAVALAQLTGTGTLHWLGVGNVEARLLSKGPAGTETRASMLMTGGIVGYRLPGHLQSQQLGTRPGDLLVMATDGIVSPGPAGVELSAPATSITESILDREAKPTDDALVLAARHRGTRP